MFTVNVISAQHAPIGTHETIAEAVAHADRLHRSRLPGVIRYEVVAADHTLRYRSDGRTDGQSWTREVARLKGWIR